MNFSFCTEYHLENDFVILEPLQEGSRRRGEGTATRIIKGSKWAIKN